MTQEYEELLLKDLCARLPHHCRVFYEYVDDLDGKTYGYNLTLNTWCINEFIANKAVIKPYLRPMSSMTEEEKKEFDDITLIHTLWGVQMDRIPKLIDWLNAHHFDYRGLIEKGLALEVPEGMYNIKEK